MGLYAIGVADREPNSAPGLIASAWTSEHRLRAAQSPAFLSADLVGSPPRLAQRSSERPRSDHFLDPPYPCIASPRLRRVPQSQSGTRVRAQQRRELGCPNRALTIHDDSDQLQLRPTC
jgi:hypothetical protein